MPTQRLDLIKISSFPIPHNHHLSMNMPLHATLSKYRDRHELNHTKTMPGSQDSLTTRLMDSQWHLRISWAGLAQDVENGSPVVASLVSHYGHMIDTRGHCSRDGQASLVVVWAFHWTKGKEDAAFALAWPHFLPPTSPPHTFSCILTISIWLHIRPLTGFSTQTHFTHSSVTHCLNKFIFFIDASWTT